MFKTSSGTDPPRVPSWEGKMGLC